MKTGDYTQINNGFLLWWISFCALQRFIWIVRIHVNARLFWNFSEHTDVENHVYIPTNSIVDKSRLDF